MFLGATAPGRVLADRSFDEDGCGSDRRDGSGAFFGKMSKVRPPLAPPEEPPELDAEPWGVAAPTRVLFGSPEGGSRLDSSRDGGGGVGDPPSEELERLEPPSLARSRGKISLAAPSDAFLYRLARENGERRQHDHHAD